LCSLGRWYGICSHVGIVLVLLMSMLQMDNCMNMYVFGVYSLKNNDVGPLFGWILNGMLGLLPFWIG
jgi:prolipoprotein diacylglyceryltransferase